MELKGERLLAVDRPAAWRALNDPEVLRACIPGCETVEKTGENEFAVGVAAVLGPVRARFQGRILIEDVVEPASYTLRFEGQGGAAGFAKGAARVTLDEQPGPATRLGYAVEAQVGGRLAQVGSRLIDSAALKLADEFFAAFEKHTGGPAPAAAGAAAATKPGGIPKWVYALIAIAAVVLGALLLR
jgi:carbon monoxide dehydrogenase subunit G